MHRHRIYFFVVFWFVPSLCVMAGITTGPIANGGGGGGSGIPTLNGSGTNTTLISPTINGTIGNPTNVVDQTGIFLMSPSGGNDGFADMANATPNYNHQLGLSWYGSLVPYMWWSSSTSQGAWDGSFQMPGFLTVGDRTHMNTNLDIGEDSFTVNGTSATRDPATLAVPADNVIRLRNQSPKHFSAMAWNQCDGDGGFERGAIGYGNSLAGIYSGINYCEDFGGNSGFYFTTASFGKSFGMENSTQDLVKYRFGQQTNGGAASNVVFRVDQSGNMTNSGTTWHTGLIYSGTNHIQITQGATGNLNMSAVDTTQRLEISNLVVDATGNSPSGISFNARQYIHLDRSQFDLAFGDNSGDIFRISSTTSGFNYVRIDQDMPLYWNTGGQGAIGLPANPVGYVYSLTNFMSYLTVTNGITPSSLNYRAGQQAVTSLATSQAVTFSSPFSSAVGTSYAVNITADGTLAGAVGFGVTSKTTNGFTITLSAGVAGGVTVDYTVWQNN